VAGDVPFPGQSAADVISKHLTEPVTPPRHRNPMVSPAVEHVILKMMQKAREDRYQTPAEVLRDLEAVAQGGRPDGFAPAPQLQPQQPPPSTSSIPKLRRSRILRSARRLRRR
jgi:serine/threonine protein kinase